ncbi:MAG: hypothetical protein ACP5QR_05215, partial [Rhizomicrobium sp.]
MSNALEDFPDEVREILAPHMPDAIMASLDTVSIAVAKKRDEAKSARSNSGIEDLWIKAEEAYIGIDDANRHEFADAKWAKPMSMDGPLTTGKTPSSPDVKATAFVRLTSR